jgi:transposase
VDTHADLHVAAALDSVGGLLGVREFPGRSSRVRGTARLAAQSRKPRFARRGGHRQLRGRLARYLAAAGVRVVEVDRPDRRDRHRQGKSGPLDAVSAARAA